MTGGFSWRADFPAVMDMTGRALVLPFLAPCGGEWNVVASLLLRPALSGNFLDLSRCSCSCSPGRLKGYVGLRLQSLFCVVVTPSMRGLLSLVYQLLCMRAWRSERETSAAPLPPLSSVYGQRSQTAMQDRQSRLLCVASAWRAWWRCPCYSSFFRGDMSNPTEALCNANLTPAGLCR